LFACCKECRNKANKIYADTHREEERARGSQHYQAHREEVLAWHRQHYGNNREREHARGKQYREKNPEKIRAKDTRYRENHPEEERARGRRWYQANPEKGVARAQRHIARKNALEGQLSAQHIQAKLKAQKFACWYCFRPFAKRANGTYIYHLDHVVPVSRPELAPRHDVNNVVLACPHCNQSKGNKPLDKWTEGGRLF